MFSSFVVSVGTLSPTILVSFFTRSITLESSILYSIVQTFVLLLAWLTIRAATKEESHLYNFGYGKLESLASLAVAALLTVSLAIIIYASVRRIENSVHIHGVSTNIAVLVLIITTVFAAWEWHHTKHLAMREFSPLMESAWRLFRAKTIAHICASASLALSVLIPRTLWWGAYIDPAGGILQSIFLATSAYAVISMSVNDLVDGALEESLQIIILRELAAQFNSYTALHGIRSRRSGSKIFIELFLEFPTQQTLGDTLLTINCIKASIHAEIAGSEVVVVPTSHEPVSFSRISQEPA